MEIDTTLTVGFIKSKAPFPEMKGISVFAEWFDYDMDRIRSIGLCYKHFYILCNIPLDVM